MLVALSVRERDNRINQDIKYQSPDFDQSMQSIYNAEYKIQLEIEIQRLCRDFFDHHMKRGGSSLYFPLVNPQAIMRNVVCRSNMDDFDGHEYVIGEFTARTKDYRELVLERI
jgi:hypothetical protein